MPNRRRRKLSTAMSAVAALAVASPFAVTAVSELNASSKPAPQQHEFVQASVITDLPGEIMSALQSSLSQFGIVVPNMSSITGSSSTPASTGLMPGGLTTTPGMTAATPGLPTANTLAPPNFADPSLANPTLNNVAPALPPSTPLATPPTGASVPSAATGVTSALPPATGVTSALPPATGVTSALPPATGATSALPPATGATSAMSPFGATSPLPAPGAVGSTGADPYANTFPLVGGPLPGDPSLGMPTTTAAPSGGLMSDLSNAFSQLGGTQAIDLLKGVVVPSIMQAIKSAGTVPAAAAPAAVPAPAAAATP